MLQIYITPKHASIEVSPPAEGAGVADSNSLVDPVSAYALLLISDVLETQRGWYLWESLVNQGHLQAAIRILHDLSPILYRSPGCKIWTSTEDSGNSL